VDDVVAFGKSNPHLKRPSGKAATFIVDSTRPKFKAFPQDGFVIGFKGFAISGVASDKGQILPAPPDGEWYRVDHGTELLFVIE